MADFRNRTYRLLILRQRFMKLIISVGELLDVRGRQIPLTVCIFLVVKRFSLHINADFKVARLHILNA